VDHAFASTTALARTQASVNQSQRPRRSKKSLNSTASGRLASPACTAVPTALESHDWGVLQEIFRASREQFLRMAYVVLRNREDAEDALQDALISAYKHLRSFEGRSALKTWFTRVVLNAALMIRRRRKSTHIEFVTESSSGDGFSKIARIPDKRPNPEKQYAATETFEFVKALIDGLSPGLREAFTMTYFDENRAKEAGAKLGVNMTTFKSRLFRARKELVDEARTAVDVRSVSR
jgi:RNA polymerase sigma-70 factor, ECF subfamily